MTVRPPASIEPGAPSPHHGRRGIRRWLLIFGSVAVLVVIGAVTVYAATTGTDEPEAAGQLVPPSPSASSVPPTARTAPPTHLTPLTPVEQPTLSELDILCRDVLIILNDVMTTGGGEDYVETRRAGADRIRALAEDYPAQQEALEAFADELDAAAQLVEDDPSPRTEQVAFDREEAAGYAFFDAVGCE